jgi:hypothetical protein
MISNGDTFYMKVIAIGGIYKSLSDVADRAAPMYVARQRVLAVPRTLARPKVLD